MSAVYLQDGDSLTVRFTLAQGWDVGGGSPGYEIVEEEESTCSENGYRYYECSYCGATKYESLPREDHVWGEDGTCVNCSAVQPQSLFYTDNLSDNGKRRNYL